MAPLGDGWGATGGRNWVALVSIFSHDPSDCHGMRMVAVQYGVQDHTVDRAQNLNVMRLFHAATMPSVPSTDDNRQYNIPFRICAWHAPMLTRCFPPHCCRRRSACSPNQSPSSLR